MNYLSAQKIVKSTLFLFIAFGCLVSIIHSESAFASGYKFGFGITISGSEQPHNGYSALTNKCKICHAVHLPAGYPDPDVNYKILRANSPSNVCGYCHRIGGVTAKIIQGSAHEAHLTEERGPNIICIDCHRVHTSTTGAIFRDWQPKATTTICGNCHSKNGTYDAVDDPEIGAKNNWSATGEESKIYVTSTNELRPTKKKWCAGCHDESPSTINSVTAPNVIGEETGAYIYGNGWGFYRTGHGLPTSEFYPSKGGAVAGAGKNCDNCHDITQIHIDGEPRTFAGTSAYNYREGYRLKLVSGTLPMHIPRAEGTGLNADQFKLCFSCHNSTPFLNSNSYSTNMFTDNINRHYYHLNIFNAYYPAAYNYSSSYNSRITCVVCHNVHGSTRLAMIRDGSLINRQPGLRIWYYNPGLVTFSPSSPPPSPEDLPLIASTGTLWMGGTATNLCNNCHPSTLITAEYRTPWWAGPVPNLSWTFEANYTRKGVYPDPLMTSGGSAEFRVKYYDKENSPPTPTSAMQVWVDRNDNGTYGFDEKYSMTEVDGGDTDYTDGKIYNKILTLSYGVDGNIDYRFDATDGTYSAIGPPTLNNNARVDTNGKRDVPSEYSTIQAAINASSNGDTVLVANGIYSENINFSGKNITVESANGPALTEIQGTSSNSPVVTFNSGEASSAVIDGFTIDNQAATANATRGIYIGNASPTIKNSIIDGNSISTAYGGGIYVTGGSATVENTTISNNASGQNAGGLYATNSAISLTNCIVNNNSTGSTSSYDGGGIYLTGTSSYAMISGSTINSNIGRMGAGVYINGSTATTPLSISNATISSNASGNQGGGIYLTNVTNTTSLSATTVSSNTATSGGGGILSSNSPLSITSSHIISNSVSNASQRGGGLSITGASAATNVTNTNIESNTSTGIGGGISIGSGADMILTSGSINGNRSSSLSGGGIGIDGVGSTLNIFKANIRGNRSYQYGGGIYVAATVSISNSTISGNSVDLYDGAGIYNSGGTLSTMNCSLAGNYAKRYGGGIRGGGTLTNNIIWGNNAGTSGPEIYGSPTVSYSDVAGGYGGTGNINVDPSFVNHQSATDGIPTTAGNFHIQSGSLVADQGTSTGAPSDDIDDESRPSGSGIDMGSDEYVPPPSGPTIGVPQALSANSIRWNFTDSANNETGFKAHDSSHTIMTFSASPNLSWLDEYTLLPNIQYTRHVHAYNLSGDSSASADATKYTLSQPPTFPVASDGTYPDKINVFWTGSLSANHYHVYRDGIAGVGTLIYDAPGTSFDDSITGAHTYYIYSVNNDGENSLTYISDNGSTT